MPKHRVSHARAKPVVLATALRWRRQSPPAALPKGLRLANPLAEVLAWRLAPPEDEPATGGAAEPAPPRP